MGILLYNVYAWRRREPSVLVGKELPIKQASALVESYLDRGLEWDAFMVNIHDDPGYLGEDEYPEESKYKGFYR